MCAVMAVFAVSAAAFWVPAPTRADDTTSRPGWCYEGEGISVVVDWHQAPAEAGTPQVLDGSLTHLVRCVPLPEGQWVARRVDALAFAGVGYAAQGSDYVTAVNGLTEILPAASWNVRVGSGSQWTEDYDPIRGDHDSIAFTYWDQEVSPERPYPVVNPAPLPSPAPTPTPSESAEPTPDPSTPGPVTSSAPGTAPANPTGTPAPTSSPEPPRATDTASAEPSATDEPSTPTPVTPPSTSTPPPTPPTRTPAATAAAPASPAPTPEPATPTATPPPDTPAGQQQTSEPVWGSEPVTRVPAGTSVPDGDSPWAGLAITGAFTAMTASGVVLVRRLRHSESGHALLWEEE